MGIFRRKVPIHYIEIHPHNLGKNDWIIVLEAWTIVGPSPERLRIAKATTDRKIVTKYNIFLRKRHYLVLEGYDKRIHALYFCPQLYRYDSDHKLVPLEGEEIGHSWRGRSRMEWSGSSRGMSLWTVCPGDPSCRPP
jgi:hypothetical protein